MSLKFIKHHEFWPPRLFETPFYLYLLWQCLLNGVSLRNLAKADYALDHGEIGLGSKYQTQQFFDQSVFPLTEYLPADLTLPQRQRRVAQFARQHGFPVILKPDIGMVGKGLLKLFDMQQLEQRLGEIEGAYLLQSYCALPLEFGVFYQRSAGVSSISGINRKHFPSVSGDGESSIRQLARAHPRYSEHWHSFLQYLDTDRIPAEGEQVLLSFIGSHTMGCLFTNDSELQTDALQQAVFELLDPVEGYNYGRLDVKAESVAAFQRGQFTVIEVNGISSLPTHMFDPKYSLLEAYKIFFYHGRQLVRIAGEHKHQTMELMSLLDVARRVKESQQQLERLHNRIKQS